MHLTHCVLSECFPIFTILPVSPKLFHLAGSSGFSDFLFSWNFQVSSILAHFPNRCFLVFLLIADQAVIERAA